MSKVIDMIEDYYTRGRYALEDVVDDLEEVIERLQEAQKRLRYMLKERRTIVNKYKLCRVYRHECGEVKPVDENGNEYGNTLYTYDNETDYAYAIYENLGDNDYEDWEEYGWYDDDFAKAVEEYNKLKGEK